MLQDEGILFLWVTGRAMEVGRECLRVWGYTRVDEVIWVKTNQVPWCFTASKWLLANSLVSSSNASSERAEQDTGSTTPKNTC